jgi:hypothetical protein
VPAATDAVEPDLGCVSAAAPAGHGRDGPVAGVDVGSGRSGARVWQLSARRKSSSVSWAEKTVPRSGVISPPRYGTSGSSSPAISATEVGLAGWHAVPWGQSPATAS